MIVQDDDVTLLLRHLIYYEGYESLILVLKEHEKLKKELEKKEKLLWLYQKLVACVDEYNTSDSFFKRQGLHTEISELRLEIKELEGQE